MQLEQCNIDPMLYCATYFTIFLLVSFRLTFFPKLTFSNFFIIIPRMTVSVFVQIMFLSLFSSLQHNFVRAQIYCKMSGAHVGTKCSVSLWSQQVVPIFMYENIVQRSIQVLPTYFVPTCGPNILQ